MSEAPRHAAIVMNGRISTSENAARLVASGKARPATQLDVNRSGIAVHPDSLKAAAALSAKKRAKPAASKTAAK